MTVGRFLVRWIVALVVINLCGFVGHGLLLKRDYLAVAQTNPGILRTQADSAAQMPWMLLAFALLAAGMVWMYAQGNTGKPWIGQGIRFGIAVWIVSAVYSYLIYYSVEPWPAVLVVKEAGWDFLTFVLTALAIAALSSKDASQAAKA